VWEGGRRKRWKKLRTGKKNLQSVMRLARLSHGSPTHGSMYSFSLGPGASALPAKKRQFKSTCTHHW